MATSSACPAFPLISQVESFFGIFGMDLIGPISLSLLLLKCPICREVAKFRSQTRLWEDEEQQAYWILRCIDLLYGSVAG